jgi:hypothetical protein
MDNITLNTVKLTNDDVQELNNILTFLNSKDKESVAVGVNLFLTSSIYKKIERRPLLKFATFKTTLKNVRIAYARVPGFNISYLIRSVVVSLIQKHVLPYYEIGN